MVIIDFSPVSSLSRRYRYYAALNRDIYEHLTGYSEQAMWQVSRHLHPNNLYTTRVDDLLQAVSNRSMEQWQVVVSPSSIQLHYEDDHAYDVVLQPDHSIKRVLSTCRPDWPRPAWRDVVLIADFSALSDLADENWNFLAMHPLNHVPLTTMEEKALWQYTRFVYANQVDTFTFDHMLSGIVERIEEQWQVSLTTDDLEVRYDENNGLEGFQVTCDQPFWNLRNLLDQYRMKRMPKHQLTFTVCEWEGGARRDLQVSEHNLETNSVREHQAEFFFYKLLGDWHTAQKLGNYWRQHYDLDTLPIEQVPDPAPSTGALPGLEALDPATVYAAQLMTMFRFLPPTASPEQQRSQLLTLVQDSEVRNLFTPIDLNTLATQIHQLDDLVSEANALPMEVHLTPSDASLL
eukprot:s1543_g35.t1